jgi:acetyl esterase/lipase
MRFNVQRRCFLAGAAVTGAMAMSPFALGQNQTQARMSTHTYKRVGDLEIKADVHLPPGSGPHPTAVWIHGGALIMGNRAGMDGRIKPRLLDAGYAIVSIDYRLAPETKMPAILEDVQDAFAWLRREGARQMGLDTTRIAVLGGSAGGYLTLATGYRVEPRPTVLVSFWGYGDVLGDWYTKPSPHARHLKSKLAKDEAYRQVSGQPIADARDRKGDGGAFYQYCRQQGIWPSAVSGWDQAKEASRFDPYLPVKNVTAEYPPTYLIHGTVDTDVPYEQSVMMAEQFKKFGVVHELVSIPGGEHGLGGGDPKLIEAAYDGALKFVDRFMRGKTK